MTLYMIYAAVPRITCKGKCQASCGPIAAHPSEVAAFEEATGKKFPDALAIVHNAINTGDPMICPYLTPLGTCEVYQNRPLLCRLWGVAESMPCHWGCKPARLLSDREAGDLLEATRWPTR